jgi:hypothetical protein
MDQSETPVTAKEGVLPNGVAQKNAELETEREQLRQLQLRMSAEIERVRAQLKERNGRWKVRKETTSM